jgi:hypothetical protein
LLGVLTRVVQKILETLAIIRPEARPDHEKVRWQQNVDEVELQDRNGRHRAAEMSDVRWLCRSGSIEALSSQRYSSGLGGCNSHTSSHMALVAIDNRISLNFDEHPITNQARHFDHRGRRCNLRERLLMRSREFLPEGYVRNEHSSSNNMLEACTSFVQRGRDYLNTPLGLKVGITRSEQFSVGVHGCATGHGYVRPYSHGTAIGNQWFPFRPGEY